MKPGAKSAAEVVAAMEAERPHAHDGMALEDSYRVLVKIFGDVQMAHQAISRSGLRILGLSILDRVRLMLDQLEAIRASADSDTEGLATEILAELFRARAKFPGDNVTMLALMEEVGELAKASFEESRERVRKEAVQVATMAMRVVLDGDSTLDRWRDAKGLDSLTPSGVASGSGQPTP